MKSIYESENELIWEEYSSLFDDPEGELKKKEEMMRKEFAIQDEWAEKSEIFKKILQSEISDDPETRYKQTNSPKSKTRNALISRSAYQSDEEWEDNLKNNKFYVNGLDNAGEYSSPMAHFEEE